MIIGISGRAGHGKDTVGKIVQYLNVRGGPGPLTIEQFIAAKYDPVKQSGWTIKKYATKLKQIAGIILGVDPSLFEDQEYKASYLPEQWDYLRENDSEDLYAPMWKKHRMTVREFLQRLGTEGMRDGVHQSLWINALFADYQPLNTKHGVFYAADYPEDKYLRYPNWVITDMRFVDEARAVKERGGVTIRVNRVLPDVKYPTLESLHVSETSLDDYEFDYVIDNNGTLGELLDQVKAMLSVIGVDV